MSFFELPPEPEPPEAEEPEVPEWAAAPSNVLGGAVPIRLVLAKTSELAVAVLGGMAYPTGFEFKLVIRTRWNPEELDDFDPLELHHRFVRRHGRGSERDIPPELLRFGVEFSDGSKATNLQVLWGGDPSWQPPSPVLMPGRGGGGAGNWETEFWVWPLPPEGPLAFVCEWPAREIPLTRLEVDAALVREAAAQAEILWEPDRGGSSGGSWARYGMFGLGSPQPDDAEPDDSPPSSS
ncbi:MAG TPA: hypothetical protein VE289_07755 [Gaiellaceae bacterium]|nr:hypothetical protein [Gaiellaceae bacterium]